MVNVDQNPIYEAKYNATETIRYKSNIVVYLLLNGRGNELYIF
jgi:hypothetical protein